MRSARTLTLFTHIIGWALFISLILGFTTSMREDTAFLEALKPSTLAFCFIFIGLFYLNGYLLFPKLYLRKQYFLYFAIIIALFIAICLLRPFDTFLIHHDVRPERFGPPPQHKPDFRPPGRRPTPAFDIVSMVLFVMTLSFSTALHIFRQWRTTEQRALQAETERSHAELSFLKAQINPHFLYNTLNIIYSLSVMKSDATPEAIMKLSHIMRYVTDEATRDYVPLEMEVQSIRNYIDLQRLRLNEKSQIDFSANGEFANKQIAPLILMTFIENVFKYGISSHEASTITIKLNVEDRQLIFFCQNRVFSNLKTEERPGVGIENTQKRLNFLYPNKHQLNISSENNLFTVHLQLLL